MNKKFLSAMLTVAMFFAAGSAFVSCKDYDDDIKNLQSKIDGLQSTINTIQNQITQGYLLTGVTDVTGGVQITLSNGKTYTITNGAQGAQGEKGEKGDKGDKGDTGATGATGAAGKNGTVWTIGEDGYWYKDGVKYTSTAFPEGVSAVGKDGAAGGSGTPGAGGAAGAKGETGNYWMPESDGYFYEYTAAGVKTGKKSDFKWNTGSEGSGTPSVDAAWNSANQTLTLGGLLDSNGNVTAVTISLNGTLKSLVFIPHFYLDGIETIEYPWFADKSLVKKDAPATYQQPAGRTGMKHHGKTIANNGTMYNYLPDLLSNLPQAEIPTRKDIIYGPIIGVDYEINPANASLSYDANLPTYKVLTPEVVYANTRAAASKLEVTSPKTFGLFNQDKDVFEIKTSSAATDNSSVKYLQAGLKIKNPQYLEPYPTSDDINGGYLPATLDASYTLPATHPAWYSWYKEDGTAYTDKDNTIALQLHNVDNGDVTSDYALLIPSRLCLEGLIWNNAPMYSEPAFGSTTPQTGDENGWYSTANKIFVWDSPEEALDNDLGAALELAVDDDYIDLKEYLGIQILKENVITRKVSAVKWPANEFKTTDGKSYGKEEYYDMHYEFQLIDYEVSGNVTRDSRYATFTDTDLDAAEKAKTSYNGRLRALSVNEIKQTINVGSTTAVDREPLVRVLVKTKAGDVMLDGYILLHITNTKANLNVETYPAQEKKFDFCNGVKFVTDWAQFSKLILQDAMKNYEKNTFDYFYWADCYEGGTAVSTTDAPYVTENAEQVGTTLDGHKTYSMRIFNFGNDIYGLGGTPATKGNSNAKDENTTGNAFENKALGVVEYYPNADGQTNHRWEWILSPEEVEYLTEGKAADEEVTVVRWIRFQAKLFAQANAAIPAGVTPYTQDNYNAPYPYIWVKMELKIKRNPTTAKFNTKIEEYWYQYQTGSAAGWTGYLLDREAPRGKDEQGVASYTLASIKDKNWDGLITNTLVGNKVTLTDRAGAFATGAYTGRFYFAPKTYTITALNGKTYTITPKRKATDNGWQRIYCAYQKPIISTFTKTPTANVATIKTSEYHQWNEANLKDILAKCAVHYDRGAFTNDTLYAVDAAGVYTPIAYIMDQDINSAAPQISDGAIRLGHWLDASGKISDTNTGIENTVCYDVLNAIGYAAGNANIEKQLRSWLGFVGTQCDFAYYVEQAQNDGPVATVLGSWERPINLKNVTLDDALDAKTVENKVYLLDNLKLFDWRGETVGYMWNNHWWFWGYYNIKKIAIDLRANVVETKLNASTDWVKLNTVTTQLRLWPLGMFAPGYAEWSVANANFPDLTNYCDPSQEAAIEQIMGISPRNEANLANFGGFYYENVSGNVTEFDVRFPITIGYEWGELTEWAVWHINTTAGH